MKAFLESLLLPFIFILVFLRETLWQYRVKQEFYSNLAFQKKDRTLLSFYKQRSPFKISKTFLKSQGEKNIHTFGSTPLHVYHSILKRWIKDHSGRFLELGCGTGRGLLFLSSFSSCQVEGIEWNLEFVKILQTVQKQLEIKNIHVTHDNYQKLRSFRYDWIYLYEFFFSEEDLKLVCNHIIQGATKNTKIISVSFPLSDYHPDFEIIDSFLTWFAWGRTVVFLNAVKRS